jgi:tRNA threonylcarbamoyl adenosine modification protein (Sua5/YciO/YrdC/YwlC family)
VAFPTETVYGLGARARDAAAVARVYALKGRPPNHPLIVHLADAGAMGAWAAEVPEAALRLAAAHWPGPLTLVLRARADVPLAVTGGAATVALRVPDHPVALALLRALGEGVAAPSANRFGRVSPTSAAHVLQEFESDADLLVLDGGPCAVGLESTIVDLSGGVPRLLRPGGVGVRALIDAGRPADRRRGRPAAAGPRRPPAPLRPRRPHAPGRTRRARRVPLDVAVLARRAPPPGRPVGAAPWLASAAPRWPTRAPSTPPCACWRRPSPAPSGSSACPPTNPGAPSPIDCSAPAPTGRARRMRAAAAHAAPSDHDTLPEETA